MKRQKVELRRKISSISAHSARMKVETFDSCIVFFRSTTPCVVFSPEEGLCLFYEADVSVCLTANIKYFSGNGIVDGIYLVLLFVIKQNVV